METLNQPEIVIDGIKFKLIAKLNRGQYTIESNQYIMQYNAVHIQSTTIDNVTRDIMCYPSNSELGMWRLAIVTKEKSKLMFYKSNDYVQSTLIHFDLQKHINKHYSNLPNIDINDYICDDFVSKSGSRYTRLMKVEIRRNNDGTYIHYLLPSSKGAKYNMDMTTVYFDYYMANRITASKICPFITDNVPKCGENKENLGLNKFFNNIHNILSSAYTIEDTVTLYENRSDRTVIQNYNNQFSDTIYLEGNIMSIDMNPVSNATTCGNKPLVLHYYECNLFGVQGVDNAQTQYMPILLTTKDNKINEYGLNSIYIYAGAYICKLFDYDGQCNKDKQVIKCTDTYSFIGHRYRSIFPFSQLSLQDNNIKVEPTTRQPKSAVLQDAVPTTEMEISEEIEEISEMPEIPVKPVTPIEIKVTRVLRSYQQKIKESQQLPSENMDNNKRKDMRTTSRTATKKRTKNAVLEMPLPPTPLTKKRIKNSVLEMPPPTPPIENKTNNKRKNYSEKDQKVSNVRTTSKTSTKKQNLQTEQNQIVSNVRTLRSSTRKGGSTRKRGKKKTRKSKK